MRDTKVGAPAPALPAVAMAAPADPVLSAVERDRIAYVAFVASVSPTDEVKAAQKGRGTQADEDAYEAANETAPGTP